VTAGFVADKLGAPVAFVGLACVAGLGLLLIWLVMPETRRDHGEVESGP
jgi:predicted MFS family arabinose efflux permease